MYPPAISIPTHSTHVAHLSRSPRLFASPSRGRDRGRGGRRRAKGSASKPRSKVRVTAIWSMGAHGVAAAASFPGIAEVYAKYRDILSGCMEVSLREGLAELSKFIDNARQTLFDDIPRLMSLIDLDDSCQFSSFYDFVFFISREKKQKNITIQRAVAAWRIVLKGRFRLLDRWCNFVEKYHRHNISEDTWQQLLAFTRFVNEDHEDYDPKGAWPVLIDEFVEHMHRIYHSSDYCCEPESQCSISNTFRGLNLLPGSKRKSPTGFNCNEEDMELSGNLTSPNHLVPLKRLKESCVNIKFGVMESDTSTPSLGGSSGLCDDINMQNSRGFLPNSACVVEDSLSKGLEGYHLSVGCSFQYNQKTRAYS